MIFTHLIIAKLFNGRKSGFGKEISYFSAMKWIQDEVAFLPRPLVGIFHFYTTIGNLNWSAMHFIAAVNIFAAVSKISLQNFFSVVENILIISFVNYEYATIS